MTRVHKGRHDMWWFHTQINTCFCCELHVSLPLFEGFGLDTSHVRSVPKKVCIYIYTQYIILWFFGVSFPPFLAPATSEKLAWKQKSCFCVPQVFFISIQLIDTAWRNMFSDGRIDDHEGFVLGTALFKISPSHGQPSSSEDLIGTTLGLVCQWTWLSWVDQLNPWSMLFLAGVFWLERWD